MVIQRRVSLAIASFLLFFGLFSWLNVSVNANVGIVRQDNEFAKNSENGWFVYRMEAGSTIEDAAVLTNTTNSDLNVEILGRDAEITSDGIYTVISNKLQNKAAGDWVKLDSTTITIPAAKTIEVPFRVQVPVDAAPGEYGAGLTVLPIDDGAAGGANVVIKTRNAVRMYITVLGDLKLDSEVKDLNIVDPTDEDYLSERNRRGYIGRDNIVTKFNAKNIGNIYANLEGQYTLKLPDNTTFEGTVNSLLAPGKGERDFYIRSDQPFQVGTIEIEVRYKITPLNEINNGKTDNGNVEGVLTDSVEISQELFDNFDVSRKKAIEIIQEEEEKGGTRTVVVKEQSSVLNSSDRILIYVAVGLLFVIILFQVYNIARKNRKDKENKVEKL